jgi:NADH-quinone oxidoreductase subunit L
MIASALAILFLPLLAFVVIVFVTWKARFLSAAVAITAVGLTMLLALFVILPAAMGGRTDHAEINWLRLLPANAPAATTETLLRLGLAVDPLAAIMLIVVTVVSFLVHVYSRSYMIEHGHLDPGYSRFFAYLTLFTFSMLLVVLSNNLLSFFIGWELVGLCSYLLIGFWYDRTARRGVHLLPPWVAAKKAFITTRVGDVGFLIGLIILWNTGGTLQLSELFQQAESKTGALFAPSLLGQPVLFWACLCLFAGAVGKSGQFPLHVWLPDAMEGPTPVSALIHAATMVAAGVYLVARTFPFFEAVPQALAVVAVIGGFTAIFAASMGLASNDIKRVLAYSTVSQLGYMMLALGAGSLGAGMFHLFTHAFFKALLFLAAGSVIHAVGTNDITEMGGLRRFMPRTYWTMLIGSLSLAGFPLFAGFWSKDEVLAAAASGAGPILLAFGVITVFLTAFYTFRMFFLTFHGKFRGPVEAAVETIVHHPAVLDAETHEAGLHESDGWMTGPLVMLAIPALLVGFWGSPLFNNGFQRFLEGSSYVDTQPNLLLAVVGAVLAIAGIGAAWAWYGARAYVTEPLLRFGGAYQILNRRYYVDELYMWLIDKAAIGPAYVIGLFDREGLDRLVNAVADLFASGGQVLRTAQTGRVQNYGLVLFGGMAVIALVLVIVPLVRP